MKLRKEKENEAIRINEEKLMDKLEFFICPISKNIIVWNNNNKLENLK